MKLEVLGSDSKGNCYILRAADCTLIIELGLHFDKIKQALKFNYHEVYAIVSHSHGDHSKYMQKAMDAGIDVYASKDTLEAKGLLHHHRANRILSEGIYQIGSFRVKPFDVSHDVPTFGFLIEHEESGRILFVTDTGSVDYSFPGLHNIIIEANHDFGLMLQNGTKWFLRERIRDSHMSITTCVDMLYNTDLSKVHNIVLIHLSKTNADAKRFHRQVEESTGKTIKIAEPGLTLDFNKTPF